MMEAQKALVRQAAVSENLVRNCVSTRRLPVLRKSTRVEYEAAKHQHRASYPSRPGISGHSKFPGLGGVPVSVAPERRSQSIWMHLMYPRERTMVILSFSYRTTGERDEWAPTNAAASGIYFSHRQPWGPRSFVLLPEGYPCYVQKWVPQLDAVDQPAKHQHRTTFPVPSRIPSLKRPA